MASFSNKMDVRFTYENLKCLSFLKTRWRIAILPFLAALVLLLRACCEHYTLLKEVFKMKSFFWLISLLGGIYLARSCDVRFEESSLFILVNECVNSTVSLSFSDTDSPNATQYVTFKSAHLPVATVEPEWMNVTDTKPLSVRVCGKGAGFTVIRAGLENATSNFDYLPVLVSKVFILSLVSKVVGWIYFFAWSVSYYPQMYTNYIRQSVIGFNFDFVALNIVGFIVYSVYNCGMLYCSFIQDEYFALHPTGLNPVLVNDLFFSVHALFASCLLAYQCKVYESGDQRVSVTARAILIVYAIVIVGSGTFAYMGLITWLNFLLNCSYVKLTVTMIKYIPQALMNYRRQSTSGWSIGNVMLDLTGGIFSMLQMIINSYNYDDWGSIIGDPTKFGLGGFTVFFDVVFIYQHFVLYRTNYQHHIDEGAVSAQQCSAAAIVSDPKNQLENEESPVLHSP